MNKRTGFALIILTVILAACTVQSASTPAETLTALPATTTAQPSATARPTVVPTVTPTPLSPDAQALKDIVFSDCIPVEESLPEGMEIPWNLFAGGHVLDLENGDVGETFLASEYIPEDASLYPHNIHFSPNGKWVSYPDWTHTKLFIESVLAPAKSKDEADRIVIENDFSFFAMRWVDNETVFYIHRESEEAYIFRTVFHNPFTGEKHEFLLQDLPDYMVHHWGGAAIVTHYLDGEVIPDPTMRRVVYPEMSNEPDVFATNTLWDLEERRPLARLTYLTSDFTGPLWSQDGNNLLLIGPNPEHRETRREEWFLINSNGVVNQVTHFQDFFVDDYYSISHASRSLDDRYLAFQFHESISKAEGVTRTIVLDLNSNLLEGFCIEEPISARSFRGPKWSADNKFFVISNVVNEGEIIMVDVENETAYIVGQDMRVIGWMAKPEGKK